jgi:non-ribosomal peptide synthase protein (TIGR01720 family)
LEDLQTAYDHLSQGQAVRLPAKTTSFKRWAELLNDFPKQQDSRSAARLNGDYWLARRPSHTPQLPLDYPAGEQTNSVASADTVLVSLAPPETRLLLQEVPQVYQTQINDLLLTALLRALAPWLGTSLLLLDLEGHGREEIVEGLDISRTVGWFTTIFPVILDLTGITQPGEAIKSVKEQLRAVPNRGIDYGLLRYLGEESFRQKLGDLPQAQVSFNYLGQFDQTLAAASLFKLAYEPAGPPVSPRNLRPYLLELNGAVIAGRLQMEWTYSRNFHRRTTIDRLATSFIEALQGLIAHCQSPGAGGYTPSDFPEAGLSQAELDHLLAQLDD